MVSTFYPPYNFGGDGMHIYRLSNELARRGHSVDVFYCEDSFVMLNGGEPTGSFPNHQNVNLHPLRSGFGMLSPLATQQTGIPLFKGKLKRALSEGDYDVIHYNNMSLIGIAALSYGSAIKLYTAHEHWLVCPMHVLWKLNREVCEKKSCTACQLSGKRPPQLWRYSGMMDRNLKHIDRFLSPSRFSIQKHRELGFDAPIQHLPYFLPKPVDSKLVPLPAGIGERPYFLFVGRLEYIKGVQNLVEPFRKNPGFDLLVAGDGVFRESLEAQAADCPNIKFLGRLDQDSLSCLYRGAKAVIVPSICYETFGIVIIEAFSHKTPVIVNDLGALPEVVHDSDGGIIYKTEKELISAINMLAGDSEKRDKFGENGHRAYLKYWCEEPHLEMYMKLIESVAEEKERKRHYIAERQVARAC